ncbi:MAG: sugar kinase [Elusimicrobia bacterium]|nr:sugar kinase [Elusimicrobiota bacterium]
MTEQPTIVAVGSVALDSIQTPWGKTQEALGGSAVHFALAASYFSRVKLVGAVGTDFPSRYLELLAEHQVDLEGLQRLPGKTFRWSGKFGKDLNHAKTLSTCLNVFENFRPRLPESHRTADVLFLANIDPELQMEVLSQVQSRRLVALDTMQLWIDTKPEPLKELLAHVDLLFLNDEEAMLLSRESNIYRAGKRLQSWGPRALILKKGEHGSLLLYRGRWYPLPAYPLETPKDPTGAGDAFAGGFLGQLAASANPWAPSTLRQAAIYGTVMGSFAVEGMGTEVLSSVTPRAIEERLADYLACLAAESPSIPAPAA